MDDPFWGAVAVSLCLLASTVLAASEAALAALPTSYILQRREEGAFQHPGFELWLRSRASVTAAVRTILALSLGLAPILTVSNLLGAGEAGWRAAVAAVAVALVFALALTVADVMGRSKAESMAAFSAKVLNGVHLAVSPVSALLAWIGRVGARLLGGRRSSSPKVSEEQIEYLIGLGKEQGVLTEQEEKMLTSVFDLADTMVREVMVPRVTMHAVRLDEQLDELTRQVLFQGHSRYPVWDDSPDDVIGILLAKDLAREIIEKGSDKVRLAGLLRKPIFVPETQRIDEVLRLLQAERSHMGVVVDEFGGTAGIVTIEDILEEIVGEIHDQDDEPAVQIERVSEGRYLVDGATSLRDLEERLEMKFPEDGESDTLGGFVIERVGRVPEAGAEVSFDGFSFRVAAADERRVAKVEVHRRSRASGDEPSSEVPV